MISVKTLQDIRYYSRSCGLLLLPAIAWNFALSNHLPPAYAVSIFWRDIPVGLGFVENLFRTLVFVLPFSMALDLSTSAARKASIVFTLGTLLYFSSWLALIASPTSIWALSALGFMAPAYTPVVWLFTLALLGQRLFWASRYRWWVYLAVSAAF